MERVTRSLSSEEAAAARQWYVVDATEQTLGRLASRVASTLRGKNNPAFTPHVDCGDFVIVVNAGKIRLTGAKRDGKIYHRYSGYPGGIRSETAGQLLARRPEEVIRRAVMGMLPRNRLGRRLLAKLKIYDSADHPHSAQNPKVLSV